MSSRAFYALPREQQHTFRRAVSAMRDGRLDGAGLARAVATLWPTIHLVVVQPPRPEARVPEAHLPPQAVPLDRGPDLLALAEHAARNPRPPVA